MVCMHNCAHMAAVIVAKRRHQNDERRRREHIFHLCVNIFGMNEETIIKTYRIAKFISFPSTRHSLNATKQGFSAVAGFPRVIGVIDCIHVQLVPPADTEQKQNRNRKHAHSLNVQCICDAKGIITNVVAKYPRSVHDSFILRNSVLFSKLRDGKFGDGWLVGESTALVPQCCDRIILH